MNNMDAVCGHETLALRQDVVAAGAFLRQSGVLSHSGHGNFSTRMGENHMLLTGRGVRDLDVGDLALVGLDGQVRVGNLVSSAKEIISMHLAVYHARPEVQAVVHAHPPSATVFALAHLPLPCRYEPLLRHGQEGDVPVVPWGPRGSEASVQAIAQALGDYSGTTALLLANHGILAFGSSPHKAVMVAIIFEEAARLELGAAGLGGSKDFPAGAAEQVHRSMSRVRS